MQLKMSFKKEWLHFLRTFRFGGMMITIFSFVLVYPLLFKAIVALTQAMEGSQAAEVLGITVEEMNATIQLYSNSTFIFGGVLTELCATSLLIIMILMMSPLGGEQKKHATVIPMCSGLEYKYYLTAKFVLYSAVLFVGNFLGGCAAGIVCNALFESSHVAVVDVVIGALISAIYSVFILCIYMALGLCTSRPGIMVIAMYVGQMILQVFLPTFGLTKFNPFSLYFVVSQQIYTEGFSFSDETVSLAVGAGIALAICALMYVITVSVCKSKRINNQEKKPEF